MNTDEFRIPELFRLDGRVAVVTGGSSGLGAASAVALAQCGARVVVSGRDADRCEEVVQAIRGAGGEATGRRADVADPKQVDALFDYAAETYQGLDIAVNAAGIFDVTSTMETTDEQFDRIIRTNLHGTFYCCRAAARHMLAQKKGKIINFASTDSFVGVSGEAAYCASKGGVLQLTRALAVEWIKDGINVNAVGPSDFRTPMIASFLEDPEYHHWITEAIPFGRPGEPRELVGAVIFLAASASDFMVGHTLMVDGGRTAI